MAFYLLSCFYSVKTHITLSYLPVFCNGHRPRLSSFYTHTAPSQGRNKGKAPVKHNPSQPKHQKNHAQDIRTPRTKGAPCTKASLEEHVVPQTQPSTGKGETAAGQLAGAYEGKLGKSSHICPNKAHVSLSDRWQTTSTPQSQVT